MNKEYIDILILLTKEPNLSSVAEKIGTTQSNLSKILKKMELEWGVVLFERQGHKGLCPTDKAIELARFGELISKEWARNLGLIKNKISEKKELKIMAPQIWSQNVFVPFWYKSLWCNDYRLVLNVSPMSEVNLRSVGESYDIIMTDKNIYLEDYVSRKIYFEKFYLVFNKNGDVPKSLDQLVAEKYRFISYRPEVDPLKSFMLKNKINFDIIHSYINDLNIIVNVIKSEKDVAACLPNHLYHTNKDFLYGIELDLEENQPLYFNYKKGQINFQKLLKEFEETITKLGQGY